MVETEIRSIFDKVVAGQVADDGQYYCIHRDHVTKERYALTSEISLAMYEEGRTLQEGEYAIFKGEQVRGMTFEEEMLYNMDQLSADVDLWGNIKEEE